MYKESRLPLYIQLKKELINKIQEGVIPEGSMLPTEHEFCKEYNISRFPVRQAMKELVEEGYLVRARGRGTFVRKTIPEAVCKQKRKLLGIVMANLTDGLCGQIFKGFQKQAERRGYLAIPCSNDINKNDISCIERLVYEGVSGICIFPCDKSNLSGIIPQLHEKGVYLGLLDRNPGLSDVDYIGSDNIGGAYTAVRHLGMNGFKNVVFVSDNSSASSVNERLEGYLKAVEDFGLCSITHINADADLNRYPYPMHRIFVEKLEQELIELKKHIPFGVFAVNDGIAMQCQRIFMQNKYTAGSDYGIVGFDNTVECEFASTPLTSVAQNGLLIGQTAADTAIDKIEGITSAVYKFIIPTQLIVRNSCGEKDR